jgi:hypothetical protein
MLVLYDPKAFKGSFPFHAFVKEMRIAQQDKGNRNGLRSFSGGVDALLDEDGRIRALNTFDKIHLARLKDIASAFEEEMTHLTVQHSKFQDLLSQIAGDNLSAIADEAEQRGRDFVFFVFFVFLCFFVFSVFRGSKALSTFFGSSTIEQHYSYLLAI